MQEDGADVVLVATGLPEPMRDECFKGLTPSDG